MRTASCGHEIGASTRRDAAEVAQRRSGRWQGLESVSGADGGGDLTRGHICRETGVRVVRRAGVDFRLGRDERRTQGNDSGGEAQGDETDTSKHDADGSARRDALQVNFSCRSRTSPGPSHALDAAVTDVNAVITRPASSGPSWTTTTPSSRRYRHVMELSSVDREVMDCWVARRHEHGRSVGLIELYEMVAERAGVQVAGLTIERRQLLADASQSTLWPGFERVAPPRFDANIVVVPPRAEWVDTFRSLSDRLRAALPNARVEHVGSTSVPGMAAKPIVDVMVSVPNVADEDSYRSRIEELGVVLFTRDDEHRFFCAPVPEPRTLHVHVCAAGSAFEREHLLFRDYLRTHDEDAERYEAMKLSAAEQWSDDRFGYTYAKNSLIIDILDRAETWAHASGWSEFPHGGGGGS